MSELKVKLKGCPKDNPTVTVEYSIHGPQIEIDEIKYDGDILTRLAWYSYQTLVIELIDNIKTYAKEKTS